MCWIPLWGTFCCNPEGEALTLLERTELPLYAPQHPLLCKAKAELGKLFLRYAPYFLLCLCVPKVRPFSRPYGPSCYKFLTERRAPMVTWPRRRKTGAAPGHRHGQSSQPISIPHPLSSGHCADGSLIGYGGGLDIETFSCFAWKALPFVKIRGETSFQNSMGIL